MNFRHLAYYVAVAEELHFRRAAHRLHIVQPALSQQIARLEAEIGVTLLARTKRNVQLTPAGAVFLEEARALLERRDRALDATKRRAAGYSGTLDVGFVGPAAYSVLPVIVRAFRERYPDVILSLHEHTTGQQIEMLAAGQLGIGIVRMPALDSRLSFARIHSEPVIAVLPEKHKLAEHDSIRIDQLANEGFVVVPRSNEPVIFDRWVSLCRDAGFSPRIAQEALQVHTMVGLVASGLGVALVPQSMRMLKRSDVVYKSLKGEPGVLETGLAWPSQDAPPLITGFVELAQGCFPPLRRVS
jgi:DNA-binding transcriptional LysR family regulator